jgi:hypothetical protein
MGSFVLRAAYEDTKTGGVNKRGEFIRRYTVSDEVPCVPETASPSRSEVVKTKWTL